MAAEKRNGAGSRLAGLLERPTPQPEPAEAEDVEVTAADDQGDAGAAAPAKGRGGAPKKAKAPEPRAAKRATGRTIYIPEDLWERVIVQAHRRKRTYSEYITAILDRQVPDHRVIRADPGDAGAA